MEAVMQIMNPRKLGTGVVMVVSALTLAPLAFADEPEPFEAAPRLVAAEVLDPTELRSEAHTVREAVSMRRFLCAFEMESEFGVYAVTSRRLLEIRAREVATLAGVVHMEGGPEFFRSLGKSLAGLPTAAADFVLNPAGSFRKVGDGIVKAGRRVRDLFQRRQRSAYEDTSMGDAFHGDEKREIAAALKLDVYSTNPQVQSFLHEMATARAAGNLSVDLASFALPVVGFAVVTTVKWRADVARLLRDKTPAELDRHNAGILRDMGVSRSDWRSFLRHRALSPRHKTVITAALDQLITANGIPHALAAATTAGGEVGALYQEQQAILLAHHHTEVERLVALRRVRHMVVGRTAAGKEVAFMPADYVYWTANFEELVASIVDSSKEAASLCFYVTGHVTQRATAALEHRGVTVVSRYRPMPDEAEEAAPDPK